jgi:hypothetical protein
MMKFLFLVRVLISGRRFRPACFHEVCPAVVGSAAFLSASHQQLLRRHVYSKQTPTYVYASQPNRHGRIMASLGLVKASKTLATVPRLWAKDFLSVWLKFHRRCLFSHEQWIAVSLDLLEFLLSVYKVAHERGALKSHWFEFLNSLY